MGVDNSRTNVNLHLTPESAQGSAGDKGRGAGLLPRIFLFFCVLHSFCSPAPSPTIAFPPCLQSKDFFVHPMAPMLCHEGNRLLHLW